MCGVIGIISSRPALQDAVEGLLAQQNRGKDSTGLFGYDQIDAPVRVLARSTRSARETYTPEWQANVRGEPRILIGHNRYATSGNDHSRDMQPLRITRPGISGAHNGQVRNLISLERTLREKEWTPHTTCDMELLLGALGQALLDTPVVRGGSQQYFEDRLVPAMQTITDEQSDLFVNGAYSLVAFIEGKGLLAFRSPHGQRPLHFGTREEGLHATHAFASETSAFHLMENFETRPVEPGELIFIDGELRMQTANINDLLGEEIPHKPCLFELAYFAGVTSKMDGRVVYDHRTAMGRALAKEYAGTKERVNVVMPVPDSPRPVASAMAKELGVSHEEGIIKNPYYDGRIFQLGTEELRLRALRHKYLFVKSVIEGKEIAVVDDSIVRTTTMKYIVSRLRELGARSVHAYIAFPPVRHPCVDGIDMSTYEELGAARMPLPEMQQRLGLDSLNFLSEASYLAAIGRDGCMACANGQYPGSSRGRHEYTELRQRHRATT